jgi:hypothetical protein
VLNMISDAETAVNPCAGSGAGAAVLPQGHGAVAASGMTAVTFARPRSFRAVGGFGPCTSPAVLTSPDQVLSLRKPVQQYPYPTRIAAASGGTSGPHPPREPV